METAFHLLEYEEVDLFVNDFNKVKARQQAFDDIRQVDNYRMAVSSLQSKEGQQHYRKWRLDRLDIIRKRDEPKEQSIWARYRGKGKAAKKQSFWRKFREE